MVNSWLPRVRTDLTVSEQQTANGRVVVVKDGRLGRFFRFKETEQFIVEQLDGETPLDVVRSRTEDKFGAALHADMLAAFVKDLERKGLLESGAATSKEPSGRRSRVRGSPLYLRIALFDPDRLFTSLAGRLRFLFTPRFVVFASALMLLAVGITIANGPQIAQHVADLYHSTALPLFLAIFLLTVAVHESGHGVTCKHFGGEVRETGILFIYFFPAFYCSVSDAWLFPEKSKRLWVGFAGPFVELSLWALATLMWRLAEADTWINHVSLIVMTLSGVRTLLNFNPLLKLDGYYLLSDYLEIPNLRRRSFRYVGGLLKRTFGSASAVASEYSARERRVYLLYGVLAAATSGLVLVYALVIAGRLFQDGQSAAVFLLAGLVGLKSRRRYNRFFGKSSAPSDGEDGEGDEAMSAQRGVTEPTERRKRRRGRWTGRILWLALAGASIAALFLVSIDLRIAGSFVVLPQANADSRAAVAGLVERILVNEGDEVAAGTVLARLSDKELRAELDQTEAEWREVSANLSKLTAGATIEEIQVARAGLSRTEGEVKFAQSRLARFKSLFERTMVSTQEFEDVQAQSTSAESNRVEARSRLNVLLRGTRQEEIRAAEAQLDRLGTQRHYIEARLQLLDIVSPVAGIVATPSRELQALNGQFVGQGALVARVYDIRTVTAHIVIAEKEVADIHRGQRVRLRSRAHPDAEFGGTVTAIATSAEGSTNGGPQTPVAGNSTNGGVTGRSFIVSTQIDNHDRLLKPGMTGRAKVSAGERRIVDLITRRLARTLKVEFWSWW